MNLDAVHALAKAMTEMDMGDYRVAQAHAIIALAASALTEDERLRVETLHTEMMSERKHRHFTIPPPPPPDLEATDPGLPE